MNTPFLTSRPRIRARCRCPSTGSRPCTQALKLVPGPCVHFFSVGSEEFYPVNVFAPFAKMASLTEQSGRKTTWVPRVWTKHHFVPCLGTSALALSVNTPSEITSRCTHTDPVLTFVPEYKFAEHRHPA